MRKIGAGSALIALGVLAVALMGWWAGALPAAGALSTETALVRIGAGETPSYTVPPGGEETITVEVVGAVDLGAVTVHLAYDPAQVQVTSCTALPPTGADLALCNPSHSPGVVRFSLLATEGVNGAFPLFSLNLRALAPSGTTAQLALTAPQFADIGGVDTPVEVSGGALVISGPDQPAEAVIRLDPAHSEIAPGQLAAVGVQLDVTAARPVVAATMLLQYDPQIVRPVQCTASAGSTVQGACNINFNRTQGLIKFNL
ncbi:MAG: cohesin domain-containing protein, partial [Caldilineaceae bacterium]